MMLKTRNKAENIAPEKIENTLLHECWGLLNDGIYYKIKMFQKLNTGGLNVYTLGIGPA